jgi:hypothetical protein
VASMVDEGSRSTVHSPLRLLGAVLAGPAYVLGILLSRWQRRLEALRLAIRGTPWQLRLPFEVSLSRQDGFG